MWHSWKIATTTKRQNCLEMVTKIGFDLTNGLLEKRSTLQPDFAYQLLFFYSVLTNQGIARDFLGV